MQLVKRFSLPGVILCATTVAAQIFSAPVLTTPPNVQYPPIAKAAHVTGEVVVEFSIDSVGGTVSVQTISGPMMLRGAVEEQIKSWRFKVPLPTGAPSDYRADYTFGLQTPEDDPADDLDAPPYTPCCGDVITIGPNAAQIVGVVKSVDGAVSVDVTPATAVIKDPCPGDKEKSPPSSIGGGDYVELYRIPWAEGTNYRVRVYRDGRVEWHGEHDVSAIGDRRAFIKPVAAEGLLARFQDARFWMACTVEPPLTEQRADVEDFISGNFLTAGFAGHKKSIEMSKSLSEAESAKFAWAVDKTADTHRWRHGDAVGEPYTNMREDLLMPKPGVTALMRATYRFSERDASQTLEPLRYLIAKGVDVDATDESGWTALMYAAQLDSTSSEAVHLLLEANANVNRVSTHGDTALMIAAYNGMLNEEMLRRGADINVRNSNGVTVLMLLAQHDDPDELKQALEVGADVTARDNAGHTALDYLRAASCQNPFIALPRPWVEIVLKEPPPCPSNSEEFLKSETMLQKAMKKAAGR